MNTKKKVVIVFRKINFFLLPLIFLYRLLGTRIIFIEPLGSLRNLKAVKFLKFFKIEWVDFPSYRGLRNGSEREICEKFSEIISRKIFNAHHIASLKILVPTLVIEKRQAELVLANAVFLRLAGSDKTYALAKYFADQEYTAYIFQRREFIHSLVDQYIGIKNLWPNWASSERVFQIACTIGTWFQAIALPKNPLKPKITDLPVTPNQKVPEILLFPHLGIWYANLFKKDQYYDTDKTSPLHESNIRHIELPHILTPKSKRDLTKEYQDQNITVDFIELAQPKKTSVLQDVIAITDLSNKRRDYLPVLLVALVAKEIKQYQTAFRPYQLSKVALLGFDFLFPKAAIIALQSYDIKVVATQERLMSAFFPSTAPMLDHFYVHSQMTKRLFKANPNTYVKSMKVVGDPRIKLIEDQKKFAQEERRNEHSKFQKICIVLDLHSTYDPFINAINLSTHWSSAKKFYNAILALAKKNTECLFIIRGKDCAWLTIPTFEGIVRSIDNQPNILVDQNYQQINRSYALAAMADIVIARYTSLADQCLAAGIPVLLYEPLANGATVISERHNYEHYPILVYNDEELSTRFNQICNENTYLTKEVFSEMRREYYNIYEGAPSPRAEIKKEILNLLIDQD